MKVTVTTSSGKKHIFSPEKIFVLGSRFAKNCGGKTAVSHDGNNACAAAAQAIMSGIALSGEACIDFGSMPISVTRFAIESYMLSGGVHISHDADTDSLQLSFMDKNGISSGDVVLGGECVCDSTYKIKEIINIKSYKYYYMRTIVNSCHNRQIGGRILLNVKNPELQGIVTSVLSDLGCEYSFYSEHMDIDGYVCREKFSKKLRSEGFTLGAYISNDGQSLALFDKDGRIVADDVMEVLRAMIIFKSRPSATYVARITSPDAIEEIAKKYGGNVIRTKADDVEVMKTLASAGMVLKTQLTLEFDAAYALVMILDFLKSHEIELGTLVDEIPFYNINRLVTDVTVNDNILGKLKQVTENKKHDFTHGIKVFEEEGWVVILPHNDKCEIVAHSMNEEYSTELSLKYEQLVKSLRKK